MFTGNSVRYGCNEVINGALQISNGKPNAFDSQFFGRLWHQRDNANDFTRKSPLEYRQVLVPSQMINLWYASRLRFEVDHIVAFGNLFNSEALRKTPYNTCLVKIACFVTNRTFGRLNAPHRLVCAKFITGHNV